MKLLVFFCGILYKFEENKTLLSKGVLQNSTLCSNIALSLLCNAPISAPRVGVPYRGGGVHIRGICGLLPVTRCEFADGHLAVVWGH